jgi:hypothetical protein
MYIFMYVFVRCVSMYTTITRFCICYLSFVHTSCIVYRVSLHHTEMLKLEFETDVNVLVSVVKETGSDSDLWA